MICSTVDLYSAFQIWRVTEPALCPLCFKSRRSNGNLIAAGPKTKWSTDSNRNPFRNIRSETFTHRPDRSDRQISTKAWMHRIIAPQQCQVPNTPRPATWLYVRSQNTSQRVNHRNYSMIMQFDGSTTCPYGGPISRPVMVRPPAASKHSSLLLHPVF